MRFSLHGRLVFLIVCSSFVEAQQPQANELLAHALHLADLYNWEDAGPEFAEAEHAEFFVVLEERVVFQLLRKLRGDRR